MVHPTHNVQLSTFKEATSHGSIMSRSQTLHCHHYHALIYSSIQFIPLFNRYFEMKEPKDLEREKHEDKTAEWM